MKLLFDVSFVAGVACLTVAGYVVHPAIAWAVPGVALVAFAVVGAQVTKKKDTR